MPEYALALCSHFTKCIFVENDRPKQRHNHSWKSTPSFYDMPMIDKNRFHVQFSQPKKILKPNQIENCVYQNQVKQVNFCTKALAWWFESNLIKRCVAGMSAKTQQQSPLFKWMLCSWVCVCSRSCVCDIYFRLQNICINALKVNIFERQSVSLKWKITQCRR